MQLQYTEEQRMLRDSVLRFASQASAASSGDGAWPQLADLGWLAIPIPEAYDGIGAGLVEVGIVMEGLGRCLSDAPYLSTVVLGAGLIGLAASAEQQRRWLPQVAAGALRIGLGHEGPLRGGSTDCEAVAAGSGWSLRGSRVVHDGPGVDAYIVHARTNAKAALFMVSKDAPGVRELPFATSDGKQSSVVHFDGVAVPEDDRLAGEAPAAEALQRALDRGIAAAAAEGVGCMDALLEKTVAYARTRVQFDRPLSANQVVRHKLVDMWVACEEARATMQRALLLCDGPGHAQAASGARLKVARCARVVAETAVQLHGAMGVTEELDIGHYFKRLLGFAPRHGSSASHHARRSASRATAAAS